MSLKEAFGSLKETDENEETVIKAIDKLMNKEDIELKTQVSDSARISMLKGLSNLFEEKNMKGYNQLINDFVNNYLELQVSKNRQGRKEIVEALKEKRKEQNEEEQDKLQELLQRR